VENIKTRIEGKKLIIEVDLSVKGELSKSEKSMVLATTKGNIDLPGAPGVKIGLNIYRKK
jgi:hypothetical protein